MPLPFLGTLFGKLAGSAIAKAAVGGVVSAAAGNIGRKTTNPRIDFQAMRDDAQRAGFNPLTVLRSGGMSGYMIPAMSKQSFAGQMLGGAMTGAFDAWANKDIDEYNAEVRRLDIEQRKADLNISTRSIAQMNSTPTDVYAGFGPNIPVIYGLKEFTVPVSIARRMGIQPNSYLTAGDVAELFGEGTEFVSPFFFAGQEATYGTTITGLAGGDPANASIKPEITVTTLPPIEGANNGSLSNSAFDNFLDNLSRNWNMGTPNLSGLAR